MARSVAGCVMTMNRHGCVFSLLPVQRATSTSASSCSVGSGVGSNSRTWRVPAQGPKDVVLVVAHRASIVLTPSSAESSHQVPGRGSEPGLLVGPDALREVRDAGVELPGDIERAGAITLVKGSRDLGRALLEIIGLLALDTVPSRRGRR